MSDDPEPADPVSVMLDRLDSLEDPGAPDEAPPPLPSLGRQELDELIDRILEDELRRISAGRA